MPGFSINLNGKEIKYFNLPGRNRFLDALLNSGGMSKWSKGVIWKCNDCMTSEIEMNYFLSGLRTLRSNTTWIGTIAKELIPKLAKSGAKSVKIEDNLMICKHTDITKYGG